MALRNPWLRNKDKAPRYQKPPADPLEMRMERRFSVSPKVVDAVNRLKARIAKQRKTSVDNVYVPPQVIAEELRPFIVSRRLGESETDYAKRAMSRGMLTDTELKFLIKHQTGYIGTIESKSKLAAHEKRAEELRESESVEAGKIIDMKPFLVNISWTYGGSEGRRGSRGSPPVKYSMEGVFYGWDLETTMEAAREFMLDNVSGTSSYKSKSIMDVGEFDVSAVPVSADIVGAMEVSGAEIKKTYGDEMADERFATRINAFFEHPTKRKVYADKEFGYSDSTIRYRWSGNKIIME